MQVQVWAKRGLPFALAALGLIVTERSGVLSLGAEGFFTEETPYDPRSPCSASKASSDHLVRAWHRTFGLPVDKTNWAQKLDTSPFVNY